MQEARTRWALAVVGLLVFAGSGVALYATHRPAPPPVIITPPPAQPPASEAPAAPPPSSARTAARIYVHVAGAVQHPSLYALAPGSRVMQAIRAAGGPAPSADLDAVNLAEKVQDGEKVYIPRRQATASTPSPPPMPPGNSIGHAEILPSHSPNRDIPSPAAPITVVSIRTTHGGGGKADKLKSPDQGHVNINTADADQLQRLPGVGPAMATRILAYREQAHGFRRADDLMYVRGIGPKKFAKMAPFVTVDSPIAP